MGYTFVELHHIMKVIKYGHSFNREFWYLFSNLLPE